MSKGNRKPEMTQREALEIVLTAAKTLIDGYGELPVNAGTPHRAGLAINLVEGTLTGSADNDARATSTWKCPDCGETSEGHTFKWIQNNGTVTCDCGTDMELHAVVIDGVSQKV